MADDAAANSKAPASMRWFVWGVIALVAFNLALVLAVALRSANPKPAAVKPAPAQGTNR